MIAVLCCMVNCVSADTSGLFDYEVDGEFITITGYQPHTDKGEVIPATIDGKKVISIGEEAFAECRYLDKVTIPASIIGIGVFAFRDCSYLTAINVDEHNPNYSSLAGVFYNKDQTTLIQCPGGKAGGITIPSSVTSIGEHAFSDSSGLTEINVDPHNSKYSSLDGVLYNKDQTILIQCPGSKAGSIAIPSSVTGIGSSAFRNRSDLMAINVDPRNASYSSLDGVLFNKDQTTLIQCPEGKVGGITIPDSINSIENRAFSNCVRLTSITVPNGVTSIKAYTFAHCTRLTSITLPKKITRIGMAAFMLCTNLEKISIPEKVTNIEGYAFSHCISLTSITIPARVTSIDDAAFEFCNSLASVDIPNSVTKIGDRAFYGCFHLTGITIPPGVSIIRDDLFSFCFGLTNVSLHPGISSIGKRAFAHCPALTSITIPESVTNIGSEAFSCCTALPGITIPSNVTSIGDKCFYCCARLPSITIPGSVTSIGDHAFASCTVLTSTSFLGNAPTMGKKVFEENANDFTVYYLDGKTGFDGKDCDGLSSWKNYKVVRKDVGK